MTMTFQPNPSDYRKAAEPHESVEAMEKNLLTFYDELAALRQKYRVRNLVLVYDVAVLRDDGSESIQLGTTAFGSQPQWFSLAACLYGIERQKHDEMIRDLLTGSDIRDIVDAAESPEGA